MGLNKKLIISSDKDFSYILRKGKKYLSVYFVMYFVENPTNSASQFGIIASKKVGKAHERNRAKRVLREAIRNNLEKFGDSKKVIFICRQKLSQIKLEEINSDFEKMLKFINPQ